LIKGRIIATSRNSHPLQTSWSAPSGLAGRHAAGLCITRAVILPYLGGLPNYGRRILSGCVNLKKEALVEVLVTFGGSLEKYDSCQTQQRADFTQPNTPLQPTA
jgi:hypothetical protein